MFRVWLSLSLKIFFYSFFSKISINEVHLFINKKLSQQSNKNFSLLFSQCRVGFLYLLKFLQTTTKKREIIFCAYNLPEMINVAQKLNYSIKFCDLDKQTGFINLKDLKKKISNNTIAVVLTNMFNTYANSRELKKITDKFKINLIEDNAIYFDNYSGKKRKKVYAGSIGDYTIYSFNIMKHISALYGGAVTTNNQKFIKYYKKEKANLKSFSIFQLAKQVLIFFILKLMSVGFLFKVFFLHLIKYAHKNNIKFILKIIYPSLRFVKRKLPKYYFTRISDLSSYLIYNQLKDENIRRINFFSRKKRNQYYFKKLSKIKNKNFNIIKILDKNYQNFIDFPILVKDKKKLNEFLLKRGIEVRYKHYYNCAKMYGSNKKFVNAEKYAKELICLPNNKNIPLSYIDYIVKNIEVYYSKS